MTDIPTTSSYEQVFLLNLKTSDGQLHPVRSDVAAKSPYLKFALYEKDPTFDWIEREIVVGRSIDGEMFKKIMEFCELNLTVPFPSLSQDQQKIHISEENEDFFAKNKDHWYSMLITASQLEIVYLMDMIAQVVAREVKNPDEIKNHPAFKEALAEYRRRKTSKKSRKDRKE